MPIKVRCQNCETVLNVSDQAAGKAVKCKQCGERVKVPLPGAGKPARKKPVETEPDPDDPFGGLDLRSTEDTNRKVCPGCAAPVRVDDIECPKCGVTIATGTLSDKQRRRRERKGPPPEEFYRDVWSNAWKFLKRHKSYAVRTAVVWSVCLSMSLTCLYSLRFYVTKRIESLNAMVDENANIERRGNTIVINVPNESASNVEYDGTFYTEKGKSITLWAPHIQAWREPPTIFWIVMTVVFQLGFGGWAWTLATNIAGLTMAGEKTIKRFQSDFFGNLTMGFRFYVWPTVLTLPVLAVAGVVGYFSPLAGGIIGGAAQIFPVLVLPAAVVHMAQNYAYRAWLPTWMIRDFFRTFASSMYVFMMNFFLVFLLPGAIVGTIAAMNARVASWLLVQETNVIAWLSSNVNNFGDGSNLEFLFFRGPVVFGSAFLFYFLLCLIISFPAVFMMRVIGLYGVYFRADLSIVNEFPDLEPAGFGPRYLAFIVDLIILVLLAGVGMFIGQLFGMLFRFYGWSLAGVLSLVAGGIASLVLWGMYFSRGESGAARATLGKWSIGLIVLREDDKVQTRKQALGRAAAALLSVLTLFIGFAICFFRADRRAMHDLMSKTKVVWQGEAT